MNTPTLRSVTTTLRGGLGNQMFQYAIGRSIAQAQERVLFVDDGALLHDPPAVTKRTYALDIFKMPTPFVRGVAPIDHGTLAVLCETRARFDAAAMQPLPFAHVQLKGFWQCEKYFSAASATLRHDFRLCPRSWMNEPYEREIRAAASAVCVHVRRGDYLTTAAGQRLGFLGLEYYDRAMAQLAARAHEPHLFVFSDDMAWCKANLRLGCPHTYVGDTPPMVNVQDTARDFHLMTLCRHFIIANSSFSWWAAWLGAHPDKIVIGPRRWYCQMERDSQDIMPPQWIAT